MTKNQIDILAKIAENPKVTLTELSELLGLHRASIAENTSKLQKLGVLKRVGSDKNGYWEIKKRRWNSITEKIKVVKFDHFRKEWGHNTTSWFQLPI